MQHTATSEICPLSLHEALPFYSQLVWLIIGGYVVGRMVEGIFELVAHCSMFAWRPLDAYFRLITARRNPCLIIFSVALIFGRPDFGLLGVVGWTVLSTLLLILRLLYALALRLSGDQLESWLADPVTAAAQNPRAFRTFSGTLGAYE